MDEMKPVIVANITQERLQGLTARLRDYKAGKASVDRRVIAAEQWWKLRNDAQEAKEAEGVTDAFRSKSGWLHNVIVSKHADAMEAFPEPNILPREEGDKGEAKMLSAIIPCVLEMNHFERTYSAAMWQKLKTGTGIYKVIWDKTKLNGMGDISISRVSVLNVFWEPGVEDIQDSPYFFQTELADNDVLERLYPQLKGKLKSTGFTAAKFLYDDTVKTDGKSTVIEVYYQGENALHYCKYVGDTVLFATEDDPALAERGLYDHRLYPYVFDPLFPVEGSPCGYGFVDLCRSAQTEIDLMKSAIVNNTMAGAVPRYFVRSDGMINEDEFLNLNKTLIHVSGNLGEDSIRPVQHAGVDGAYISFLDRTIQELRETSGNTETSTGNTSAGVTAASAIAALQEASGKGSRDSTKGAWRAYRDLVALCIELNRQFYDLPRRFRIAGEFGSEQFVSYSNQGLKPQPQGADFGVDMGYRLPVFDIKISAQKASVYTRMSQNELALEFFQRGFFSPQMTDQALMCLGIMDFDGRDALMQKISQNGTMMQMLQMVMQFAAALAAKYQDQAAMGQLQQIMGKVTGQPVQMSGEPVSLPQGDAMNGIESKEHSRVANAREQSVNASQPGGGA